MGPLVGDGVPDESGVVVSVPAAVGRGVAVVDVGPAGAAGPWTITVGGAGGGRMKMAMAAVIPNAVATATLAMAIHGGALRGRTGGASDGIASAAGAATAEGAMAAAK